MAKDWLPEECAWCLQAVLASGHPATALEVGFCQKKCPESMEVGTEARSYLKELEGRF